MGTPILSTFFFNFFYFYPQIQAGFHEKLGGMCFINILCGMHMHFLFIKLKAAHRLTNRKQPMTPFKWGSSVSKKQQVHMNATNDHMFAGVDPHRFCVIPPHLSGKKGNKSVWQDYGTETIKTCVTVTTLEW